MLLIVILSHCGFHQNRQPVGCKQALMELLALRCKAAVVLVCKKRNKLKAVKKVICVYVYKVYKCCESECAQMISKSHLATLGGEELMATKRSSWF